MPCKLVITSYAKASAKIVPLLILWPLIFLIVIFVASISPEVICDALNSIVPIVSAVSAPASIIAAVNDSAFIDLASKLIILADDASKVPVVILDASKFTTYICDASIVPLMMCEASMFSMVNLSPSGDMIPCNNDASIPVVL